MTLLFFVTMMLGVLSFTACALVPRSGWIGALSGLCFTSALFLWLAWWQPFRDVDWAVHVVLLVVGLAAAAALWRSGPAARGFGLTVAGTMALWVAFSAMVFPVLTRPEALAQAFRSEIEAVAAGKPYCTVANRQLTRENPSFYAVRGKQHMEPDWSDPRRFLLGWVDEPDRDLTVYVRTGEPQLRLGSGWEFEEPSGFHDLVAYRWDGETAAFRALGAEITVDGTAYKVSDFIEDSFACIPRADDLATDAPEGMTEISTPFGDFAVPSRLRALESTGWQVDGTGTDGFDFTVPGTELLPAVPDAPSLTFDVWLHDQPRDSLDSEFSDASGRVVSRAGLIANGYFENPLGLLENPVKDDNTMGDAMLAFDADGDILTSINCTFGSSCIHTMLVPPLHDWSSTRLVVQYPDHLLEHWVQIETVAKGLMATFPVPGVIPPQRLGPRPAPECLARVAGGEDCIALDALP
jgi:hypothetical protein